MKKIRMQCLTVGLGCLLAVSAGSCSSTSASSKLLVAPAKAETLLYAERMQESFCAFRNTVREFSAEFAAAAYEQQTTNENFVVSPVSVYMALALAAECSAGETQTELLNTLGVSYAELTENIGKLYRLLQRSTELETNGSERMSKKILQTSNSVWLGAEAEAKQDCLEALANGQYCYSYEADFVDQNAAANEAVREVVKEQTDGIIDRDFQINDETVFVLLNTLYLTDNWLKDGGDLALTKMEYSFMQTDGQTKLIKLVKSMYEAGNCYETETFTSFFAATGNNMKLKFLLPKEGYTVREIFTAENIQAANKAEYKSIDFEKKLKYYTRCFFPEFQASCDKDVKGILRERFGVQQMFSLENANFSRISDYKPLFCERIQHVADLKVDRKGIQGAAVTSVILPGAAGPDDYTKVYHDLIMDKPFAFLITDFSDMPLFMGGVNDN